MNNEMPSMPSMPSKRMRMSPRPPSYFNPKKGTIRPHALWWPPRKTKLGSQSQSQINFEHNNKMGKKSRRVRRPVCRSRFGQTSFQNAVDAPYFGYSEPFINASEWWYPVAGGRYQSPDMLTKPTQTPSTAFGRRMRKRRGKRMKRKMRESIKK